MEKEDFLPDDLLKDLFRNQPWERPGDDFTSKVMEQIQRAPEVAAVKKPFYLVLWSFWPYVLLFLVSVVFLMTSDLPLTDYIPGKEYFIKHLLPYLGSVLSGFKPLVSNIKIISIPLMIILAGSLLIGFDHFLFRKLKVRHQTTH
jgi:hypothetical protein